MSDDRSSFEVTKARLEDIVVQVRRKDVSLEQSLDLLEEAVRLVNQCNDLIDQTSFRAVAAEAGEEVAETDDSAVVSGDEDGADTDVADSVKAPGGEDVEVGEDAEAPGIDESAEEATLPVEIEDDERS
jgi:exodeoxyribonuclease VII small subunit